MELHEAIASRRTVRHYRSEPVPVDILNDILHMATAAPSACNQRGWRFILVNSRVDLDWLYNQGGSSVLRSSRQALLVCYRQQTDNAEWQDNIQSAAASIAYFQLLAHECGIGSCWICHLPPKKEVARYFAVPPTHVPIAMISFGYYLDGSAAGERRQLSAERILAINRWDFGVDTAPQHSVAFGFRKLCRSIYYALPFRALFRGLAVRYEKKFER